MFMLNVNALRKLGDPVNRSTCHKSLLRSTGALVFLISKTLRLPLGLPSKSFNIVSLFLLEVL